MIEVGDIVSVAFNNSQHTLSLRAKVNYIPCATGDSWQFTDIDSGDEHYVSEGCTITKTANEKDQGLDAPKERL